MKRLIYLFLFLWVIPFSSFAQEVESDWRLYSSGDKKEVKDTLKSASNQVVDHTIYKSIPLPGSSREGKIEVEKDSRIDQLSEFMGTPQNGHTMVTMKGYRVQAYIDRDKNAVNTKRAEYLNKFHDYPAYIDFLAPNFRLRIGDFHTRLDAERALNEVRSIFPDAIIVMDDIELPQY